jgi:hypothetical protein
VEVERITVIHSLNPDIFVYCRQPLHRSPLFAGYLVNELLYITGHIIMNNCGYRWLSMLIPGLACSQGRLSTHQLLLTAYSLLAGWLSLPLTPQEVYLLLCSTVLGCFQGHVPSLVARVAPASMVSLAIAIMNVSMFDLAMSRNGECLFLFGWSFRIW